MTIKNFLNRRNFLGSAGVLGGMMLSARRVLGLTALLPAPAQQRLTGFGATGNVYEELGVTTVINGQGTMTYLGGSLPRPEVAAVMALAAEHFVSIVEVESREDVKRAINSQTAMMHFSNFANAAGQIKVDEWVKLAHENQIPAFNDAAADTPPVSHLWDYANMGYDLIAFSGGKAIRGPQCAGLLIGKKELIANALL